jgi:hypothetical protein
MICVNTSYRDAVYDDSHHKQLINGKLDDLI